MPRINSLIGFFFFFCLLFFRSVFSDHSSSDCKDWKRIYLVSYPQSGNHWIRYCVEEASGIATSSVYIDFEPPGHMKKIFPWGGYCCNHGYTGERRYPKKNESVLLKTHFPYSGKTSPFDRKRALMHIRIVRNPVDTFFSRYVKLPKGPLEEKIPSKRVDELMRSWKIFQNYWNRQKSVLTLRYEDLLNDPASGIREICKALKYNVSEEDIQRAIAKYPPEGFEYKHIHGFRKNDLKRMAHELRDLLEKFGYEIPLL